MAAKPLVLVPGTLEWVESMVEQCKARYNAISGNKPVGLLDQFTEAFGMRKNPVRMSQTGRQRASSSNRDIGIKVHRELELAARGEPIVAPHPFTSKVAKMLRERGWFVISSEVPIVIEELNMFTRADHLLFEPKTNTAILVELKTGRDQGYGARLIANRQHIGLPNIDIYDSEQTRAHVQLAWMHHALAKQFSFGGLKGVVILVNARSQKPRVQEMAGWAVEHARLIYERVCDARRKELATQSSALSITSTNLHN